MVDGDKCRARENRLAACTQAPGEPIGKFLYFGEMTSQAHPARKHKPPSGGVITPNDRTFVSAMRYKLPLKRIIPARKSHQAVRLVWPTSARTKRTMA